MRKRTGSRRSPIPHLVRLALQHHQKGHLGKARELYDQILEVEPGNADALHFSGLIAHQNGENEKAIAFMMRAIGKAPGRALYFLNLGQVLAATGELEKAIANYRQASLLEPASEVAYERLGDALLKQGRADEAALSYARALAIKPHSPSIINSLGRLLYQAGRLEQSVVCYLQAIALRPEFAEAHNNLGIAFKCLGRSEEAIASFHRALHCLPTLAEAHNNLGELLVTGGDYAEAVRNLQRAIDLRPDLAEAHLNLGNAYRGQGLLHRAITSYQQAIAGDPSGAYNNLAQTYLDQDNLEKAVESFHEALKAKSNLARTYSNLLYLYAFTRYIAPEAERANAEGWEKSVLSEEQRAAARKRASPDSGTFPARSRQGRLLRLGIVSAELGSHAVAQFLQPFLAQLDRRRFHLTLFPTSRRSCYRAREFKDLADSYILLADLSDGAAAERIRLEQIDVLMDTTGHTFGSRLGIFAHRAAPVQCTYIGYWSTTGLTEMDWFFADPHFPVYMEAHFSERIWRLPRLVLCYQGEGSLPESSLGSRCKRHRLAGILQQAQQNP